MLSPILKGEYYMLVRLRTCLVRKISFPTRDANFMLRVEIYEYLFGIRRAGILCSFMSLLRGFCPLFCGCRERRALTNFPRYSAAAVARYDMVEGQFVLVCLPQYWQVNGPGYKISARADFRANMNGR